MVLPSQPYRGDPLVFWLAAHTYRVLKLAESSVLGVGCIHRNGVRHHAGSWGATGGSAVDTDGVDSIRLIGDRIGHRGDGSNRRRGIAFRDSY